MSAPQEILDAANKVGAYLQTLMAAGSPGSAPIPPEPVNTVKPPYGVLSTVLSLFALQWDGKTKDPGDNGRGAWGANTADTAVIGCALPIPLLKATFGGLEASHIKGYTVEIYSQVTQKSVLKCDIADEGPSAYTHRLLDGTWALHNALGHIEYGNQMFGAWTPANKRWPAGFHVAYWINDPNGKAVEIKGVDFSRDPAIIIDS